MIARFRGVASFLTAPPVSHGRVRGMVFSMELAARSGVVVHELLSQSVAVAVAVAVAVVDHTDQSADDVPLRMKHD